MMSISMDVLDAFSVSSVFGSASYFPPAATFVWSGSNPLQGQVCWKPSCEYAGQIVPLIIGARDIGDCPNISNVLDTVFVNVKPFESNSRKR